MLRFAARTHPGFIREKNEDRFYVPTEIGPYIFAVADGMGGHAAGEVASSLSVKTLDTNISMVSEKLNHFDLTYMQNFLEDCILEANKKILDVQDEQPNLKGMGTTFTVAFFLNNELLVGHIGDSQAYIFYESGFSQITEDHSLVTELVKSGEIKPEEVYNHPQRHLLTRALGTAPLLKTDFYVKPIQSGNYVLLCTDGLTTMLRPAEIREIIINGADLETTADQLLKKANDLGGPDNITFVLIHII
ncbi:MAG: Stp1/IreP family PP2C-type Ser/Thr phosphatase [Bacillota bacterium]|nr:Stp1/IreP family PP2C-type Ser/Thr phosphatase [Bacillota bacterium]